MYQKIIIVGNLGGDPEMRYMPDGTAVTNFSVATNRKWSDAGGQHEEVTWFRVSAWGRIAENCNQYLSKGSKALIEGRIKPDPATGGPKTYVRHDGTVGASYEIQAETVRFLGSREDDGEYAPRERVGTVVAGSPIEEDAIPF